MKVKLLELTLKEIREGEKPEVAVLPWGSCEPHNLHLPYGSDTFTAEAIAEISSRKARERGARIIVLPTIPVGVNTNLMEFPLTLNLNPSTQLSILKDITKSLEKHGIKKLVIINGHGGNDFKPLIRELHGETSIWIFLIDWWRVKEKLLQEISHHPEGEHAHEAETSWMMYLKPELVHLEWADEGKVKEPSLEGMREGWVWFTRPWHLLSTSSGYGNPKEASPEKGEIIVEKITDRIARFLLELSRTSIEKNFPY